MGDHSIRLRFVGWLEHIRDHVAKHLVQELRRDDIHAQPGCHGDFATAVCILDTGAEGEADYSLPLTRFDNEIHEFNARNALSYRPPFAADCEHLLIGRSFLVGHDQSPIGKIYDVSSFNQKMGGVES